jgi:hypothetical protein
MSESSRAELLRDHATIDLLAKRLNRLIEDEAPAAELALALDHLVRTVADHLAVEDSIIYSLAIQNQPGATREDVRRAHDEFERLKANWGEYLTKWSPQEIAQDRRGFVRASKAMLPRLRDRVKLETELLFLIGPRDGSKQGSAGA